MVSTDDSQSAQNVVYALNGTSGKLLWDYATGSITNQQPVLDHGVAYVGSEQALDAFNTRDGKLLWSHQTTGSAQVLGSVNGVVYGTTFNCASGATSSIFALNASDGSVRCNYQTNDILFGGLVADGVIYEAVAKHDRPCSDPHTSTLALNASDGSVLWKTPQATDFYGVWLQAKGLLYGLESFGDGPVANLQVRKTSDGSVAWQFPKASATATVNIIGLDSNAIYVLSNDGNFSQFPHGPNVVYALSVSDGSVLWRTQIADMTPTAPTLIDTVIYLGSSDGVVSAINTADGKLLWHVQLPESDTQTGTSVQVGAAVEGEVYVAFPQGLAALSASNGSLKWQKQERGETSIAAVVQGDVYASSTPDTPSGAGQRTIFARKASDGALLWTYNALLACNPPVVSQASLL